MGNYKIRLSTFGDSDVFLDLRENNDSDLLNEYYSFKKAAYVYNNKPYDIELFDEDENIISQYKLFLNNEVIDKKDKRIFLDCFGYAQLEVVVDDLTFVSENIEVFVSKTENNQSVFKMIEYIFSNCDEYLYEEHKYSRTATGFKESERVTIDSKINTAINICNSFRECFFHLKKSLQTKLIYEDVVGNIDKLQQIDSKTIEYIINHPEELQPVDYNSGILVNKQCYEPQKTLTKSVTYSNDIYENRAIMGFLKTIILELEEIKDTLKYKMKVTTSVKKDGYISSAQYIYTRNKKVIEKYVNTLEELILNYQNVYNEYNKLLKVKDIPIYSQPQYTNIFRSIMPYRIIYQCICDWFNCGDYDVVKSDLILSFLSTSRIYEYYCLLRVISAIKNNGFQKSNFYSYKYKESRYYKNTTYNNTFEFTKDKMYLTLYYQPIIYGDFNSTQRPNKINLYRNTDISIENPKALDMLDENKKANQGNYYLPDYLIKIEENNMERYYILDAKYSTVNNIERYQLPYLVYKYLFSISVMNYKDILKGLGIICGKELYSDIDNVNNISEKISKPTVYKTNIIKLPGDDSEENKVINEYIASII